MSSISKISYLVLTLAISYAFVYPAFGDISSLNDQKNKYLDSLNTVSNIENKKAELLTKFNQISDTDKKNIETVLPDSFDYVKLVSQIDAVAANYGISINSLSQKDLSPSVGGSVADAGAEKPYHSALISFSFVGTYDNFKGFMDGLEKSLRILDIRSVKLTSQDNGIYSYNVEFETYWLQ